MSQDASTNVKFSNVNNPLFRSNFPPNYSILTNIFYRIITIPKYYIFMSMIIIRRHVHVLLISQYWLLRVNIHSKSLESLTPQGIGNNQLWQTIMITEYSLALTSMLWKGLGCQPARQWALPKMVYWQ